MSLSLTRGKILIERKDNTDQLQEDCGEYIMAIVDFVMQGKTGEYGAASATGSIDLSISGTSLNLIQ